MNRYVIDKILDYSILYLHCRSLSRSLSSLSTSFSASLRAASAVKPKSLYAIALVNLSINLFYIPEHVERCKLVRPKMAINSTDRQTGSEIL